MVNDTDWYVVAGDAVRKVYCNSYGSRTGFFPEGVGEKDASREFAEFDTVAISDTVSRPLLIAVYSYLRSVGGYYEIGCLPAQQ